jgi:hypothetical protein
VSCLQEDEEGNKPNDHGLDNQDIGRDMESGHVTFFSGVVYVWNSYYARVDLRRNCEKEKQVPEPTLSSNPYL